LPPFHSVTAAGTLTLSKDGRQIFEVDLAGVQQCVTPGHKQDELDIQFMDGDGTVPREDQVVCSMRLWVPGGQASDLQTRILKQSSASSSTGEVLVEFDRDQGTFIMPKNRYGVEMYSTFLRMHGNVYDFKIKYDDINKFYMLEKPMGRYGSEVKFFFFIICLDKPVRQGQQTYPFLVWQTHDEDTELAMNLEEAAIEEKYPGAGLAPAMEGALHKQIGKLFKVLSGKTVFAGSRKFRSAAGDQCVNCSHGQRTGLLYPNDKSFVFLHQPTLVIEYSDVDYVEFVHAPGAQTKSFELVVAKKASAGGKLLKFGAIEKKETAAIAEFLQTKEAWFTVRNYKPEAVVDDDDFSEDEEDGDFGSNDGSAVSPRGSACSLHGRVEAAHLVPSPALTHLTDRTPRLTFATPYPRLQAATAALTTLTTKAGATRRTAATRRSPGSQR